MKPPVQERVRIAENEAIHTAWVEELQQRSRELTDGSVHGLSVEDARRIVASDPSSDDR